MFNLCHVQCLEVVHLLERNTKEQCRLNTKLGLQLWDRLMTPLQGATACVGMYPFVVRFWSFSRP